MLRCIFLILLLFSSVAIGATGDVRPFVPGSLAKILAAREGKPFILVFWSLDCQYCPTELRMLSRIMDRHHKLDTVLVATDTLNDASQLASLVESYGMSQAEHGSLQTACQNVYALRLIAIGMVRYRVHIFMTKLINVKLRLG